MISLIQNLIKHVFTNLHALENIQSKFRKSCQKSVNSSAKMLILKLFLILLKLITISQLKIKHPICARCNSCYIGETRRRFKTRIDEHVKKDKKSNICKHLRNNEKCFSSFSSDCFSILDYALTQFQIKIKEGMCIDWERPNLNKQLNYLATIFSI